MTRDEAVKAYSAARYIHPAPKAAFAAADIAAMVEAGLLTLDPEPVTLRLRGRNTEAWDEIKASRHAAHAKHGKNSIECLPAGSSGKWLRILMEEVGELAHETTYDASGDIRAELIDVLAVASAWLGAIDEVRS